MPSARTAIDSRKRQPCTEHEHPKCSGHRKSNGAPCMGNPMRGLTVCKAHGGSAPQVRKAAARRRLEAQLRTALDRLGAPPPVGDPLTELQKLAGEVLAWKELARAEVSKLQTLGYSGEYGEQVFAAVQVYERALDRAGVLLMGIGRLDVDNRLVGIHEQNKLMVLRAFEAGLSAAGVAGPAAIEAKRVMGRQLRIIEGKAA